MWVVLAVAKLGTVQLLAYFFMFYQLARIFLAHLNTKLIAISM